jgi:hypothetical protein
MRQIIHLSPTKKAKSSGQVKAGRESAQSVRVSGSTLRGEVTSTAPTMTSSFDPSLRYCWRIAGIGG